MINPWLALPFQAARLGWKTQTWMVDRWLQIAGMNSQGGAPTVQRAVAEEIPIDIAEVTSTDRIQASPAEATPSVDQTAPSSRVSQAAQKVSKIHKKHANRNKTGRR